MADAQKERALRKRRLLLEKEGLEDVQKHWDAYLRKNRLKSGITQGIKTTAEIAELIGGVGALGKAALKHAGKKIGRVSIDKGSKFSKRSKRATQAQTGKRFPKKATRGKVTTSDILGGKGHGAKKRVYSKPAPKKSNAPQSMAGAKIDRAKKTADQKKMQRRNYQDRYGKNRISRKAMGDKNYNEIIAGQEQFAEKVGAKYGSDAYFRKSDEAIRLANKGAKFEDIIKALGKKK